MIPEKLTNFRVYKDGNQYMGIANADLPQIQFMTTSIKGSGIGGEIDSVVLGHLQSMQTKINFRTPTPESLGLAAPKAHELDFRGSMDYYDNAGGRHKIVALKVWIKGKPKTVPLGKLEPGATMDSEVELEVLAVGVFIDGREYVY